MACSFASLRTQFFQLGWFLLTILFLAGCSLRQQPEIRIGFLAPLSGDLAETTGQPSLDSARLAVDEVNEAGGLLVGNQRYQVVLVTGDDEDRPEAAVSEAQRLINQENVVAIVGPPFSSNAIPVATVAEQAGVPMISPTSTNLETTAGKRYAFRATFIDDFQGRAMSRFTLDELGATRAAVLFDVASSYNRGLAESFIQAFEASGGEIVAAETYTTDENQDFTAQLDQIAGRRAQVLFLPNYTDDVIRQAEQARELGIEATIVGSDSWEGERLSGNPAFEESYFSGHYCRDRSVERIRVFADAYLARFDREPNGLAALTYDAFGLLFAAMENQAETDPQAIRDGLYSVQYQGVTGPIDFTDNGDPTKSVAIWRIQGGDRGCYRMINP